MCMMAVTDKKLAGSATFREVAQVLSACLMLVRTSYATGWRNGE